MKELNLRLHELMRSDELDLESITWQGPEIDDRFVLDQLSTAHRGLLEQINGFVQFGGGFHIFGACFAPDWHALGQLWIGPDRLHVGYPELRKSDVPFGEDCMGDQFLIRNDTVIRLSAEIGEVEPTGHSLWEFLRSAQENPVEFLELHPLIQFQNEGGKLRPGELLNAAPPFVFKESAKGVSLKAVPAIEQRTFTRTLYAGLKDVPDGSKVRLVAKDAPRNANEKKRPKK